MEASRARGRLRLRLPSSKMEGKLSEEGFRKNLPKELHVSQKENNVRAKKKRRKRHL